MPLMAAGGTPQGYTPYTPSPGSIPASRREIELQRMIEALEKGGGRDWRQQPAGPPGGRESRERRRLFEAPGAPESPPEESPAAARRPDSPSQSPPPIPRQGTVRQVPSPPRDEHVRLGDLGGAPFQVPPDPWANLPQEPAWESMRAGARSAGRDAPSARRGSSPFAQAFEARPPSPGRVQLSPQASNPQAAVRSRSASPLCDPFTEPRYNRASLPTPQSEPHHAHTHTVQSSRDRSREPPSRQSQSLSQLCPLFKTPHKVKRSRSPLRTGAASLASLVLGEQKNQHPHWDLPVSALPEIDPLTNTFKSSSSIVRKPLASPLPDALALERGRERAGSRHAGDLAGSIRSTRSSSPAGVGFSDARRSGGWKEESAITGQEGLNGGSGAGRRGSGARQERQERGWQEAWEQGHGLHAEDDHKAPRGRSGQLAGSPPDLGGGVGWGGGEQRGAEIAQRSLGFAGLQPSLNISKEIPRGGSDKTRVSARLDDGSFSSFLEYVKARPGSSSQMVELDIEGEGTFPLLEGLSSLLWVCPSLLRLRMRGTRLGAYPTAMSHIARPLTAGQCLLTVLDLSNNKIDDLNAALLSTTLCTNSTLRELRVPANRIGPAGGRHLATALKTNVHLLLLDLTGNLLGPAGCSCVGMAMNFNSTLQELSLGGNGGGDGCVPFFAEGIKWHARIPNAALCTLDLSDNDITNAGATVLAQALANNTTLTKLGFERAQGISDVLRESVESLAARNREKRLNAMVREKVGLVGEDDVGDVEGEGDGQQGHSPVQGGGASGIPSLRI